ncbi:MAG: hypothetical protein ACYSYL_13515 [Planctomycetota bacterium]|jgi:hypothetical protein
MSSKTKIVLLMSCMVSLLLPNGSLAEKEEKQQKIAPVFEIQDLFESVRIPNIVVATDGTVLAFAKSGRVGTGGLSRKSALTPGAARSSMRTLAM